MQAYCVKCRAKREMRARATRCDGGYKGEGRTRSANLASVTARRD